MASSKRYATVMVANKNGKTVSVIKRVEPCPVCGNHMFLASHTKGTLRRRSVNRWKCSIDVCGHSQINEGEIDRAIRIGLFDREAGILKLTDTDHD